MADDGTSALFNNPAAIAGIRGFEFEPMNLEGQANSGLANTFGGSVYKAPSLSSYAGKLEAHPDERVGMSGAYAPSLAFRGFALGILASSDLMSQYNSTTGKIEYRSTYQLVPAAGIGFPLAHGIIRIGYSLQWVQKATGVKTVAPTASPLGYNQNLAEGRALSHNVGFTMTLPVHYLPEFNFVARNIGTARYRSGSFVSLAPNSTGTPANDPMTMDASLSLRPKLGNGTYFNLIAQENDITNQSKISVMGRISAGVEFAARDSLFLRAGYGNGYPSAGLGIKTRKGELSFTWYSEEVGGSFHSEQDTRYMFQYQMRVF